ncbi:hypothetical protein [Gellertiella hungarica]|uniref:Uncharacterized protein n=1 Tax=Gellertiella hungarica TaxID=1572859 RepID=A0A7W6NJ77_9HYPH|nr:hypothetical protein [Gellertiella hungarica]MBB4064085.1 hypothetical protein [Gellertiella hungarica]
MSEDEEKKAAESAGISERRANRQLEADRRKARAAEKLRENLMRRKQQVRARRQGEAETGLGLPASTGPDEPGDA